VVWGAVLVPFVGCLKIEVAFFFRTVYISDKLMFVLKDTISVVFRSK
jgi:hypothetical protein